MKWFLTVCTIAVSLMSFPALAEHNGDKQDNHNVQYDMRVDGMACPYCAYGIEKRFKEMEGVKDIDVDLKKGIVSVCASDQLALNDEQLTQFFKDAGFTYRSMEKSEQCKVM